MTKILFFLSAFFFLFGTAASKADDIQNVFAPNIGDNDVSFMFLNYSGVLIRTSKGTIVIDPANLLNKDQLNVLKDEGLDLVLFTHSHGDHYNHDSTLDLFEAAGAPILAESSVFRSLKGAIPDDKLIDAVDGKAYTFGNITVRAIKGVHVGPIILYYIEIGNIRIFHGGDSSYVPLVDYPSDVAFVPTGDPSPTASPDKALKMVMDLKPGVAVAIHGSAAQSKEFEAKVKEALPDTAVIIPEAFTATVVTVKKSM
jgi:L-ascorbate metabolism protein UlaG (beta-lactamase superfamily)